MIHPMLEARAREVADSLSRELPGAVIVVAPDGVMLSRNAAATALFAYSSTAVVGRAIEWRLGVYWLTMNQPPPSGAFAREGT